MLKRYALRCLAPSDMIMTETVPPLPFKGPDGPVGRPATLMAGLNVIETLHDLLLDLLDLATQADIEVR